MELPDNVANLPGPGSILGIPGSDRATVTFISRKMYGLNSRVCSGSIASLRFDHVLSARALIVTS